MGIGTLHTPNGTLVIHPGKKAQLLNNQFKSVFTLEDLQENHDILTSTQFGFRQQHSCESQLLLTTDDFARYLDNNIQVDMGILDFSKAFDKVPHKRLAAKLNYYGIRETY